MSTQTTTLDVRQVIKSIYSRYANFVEAKVFSKKAREKRQLVNARENASAHRGLLKGSQVQLVEAIQKGELETIQASYKNIVDAQERLKTIREKANDAAKPFTDKVAEHMAVVKAVDAEMIKNLPTLRTLAE